MIRFTFLAFCLMAPGAVFAQAAPESAAPESAAPESAAPESAAPESAAPESAAPESAAPESAAPESAALKDRLSDPDAKVETADVITAGKTAVDGLTLAISKPTLVTIAGLIASTLWALIALARRFASEWIGSKATRWVTLIGAPLATMAAVLAAGGGWFEALAISMGGPGALLINELGRAFKPAKPGA